MKKCNSIWLLLLIVMISCDDKNEINDVQSDFILAGVNSKKLDRQIYTPELKITFKNNNAGGYPTTAYSGDLLLDLNSDNLNDIKFHAYYGIFCSWGGCITEACELWNLNNKEIEIYETPLQFNDTISCSLTWDKLGPYSKGGELIRWFTILSSYTPKLLNSEEVMNNNWTSENFYLAIRIKSADLYKFGWIRMYINDYYDIKIKEIGFEK